MAKAYRLCKGAWKQRERYKAGTIHIGNREEEWEVIVIGKYVSMANIRPASLSRWGKLNIDIFPQIVDDKSLFVVSEYGPHHVFVPVLFRSQ